VRGSALTSLKIAVTNSGFPLGGCAYSGGVRSVRSLQRIRQADRAVEPGLVIDDDIRGEGAIAPLSDIIREHAAAARPVS
jgi:hypothetical protein